MGAQVGARPGRARLGVQDTWAVVPGSATPRKRQQQLENQGLRSKGADVQVEPDVAWAQAAEVG